MNHHNKKTIKDQEIKRETNKIGKNFTGYKRC